MSTTKQQSVIDWLHKMHGQSRTPMRKKKSTPPSSKSKSPFKKKQSSSKKSLDFVKTDSAVSNKGHSREESKIKENVPEKPTKVSPTFNTGSFYKPTSKKRYLSPVEHQDVKMRAEGISSPESSASSSEVEVSTGKRRSREVSTSTSKIGNKPDSSVLSSRNEINSVVKVRTIKQAMRKGKGRRNVKASQEKQDEENKVKITKAQKLNVKPVQKLTPSKILAQVEEDSDINWSSSDEENSPQKQQLMKDDTNISKVIKKDSELAETPSKRRKLNLNVKPLSPVKVRRNARGFDIKPVSPVKITSVTPVQSETPTGEASPCDSSGGKRFFKSRKTPSTNSDDSKKSNVSSVVNKKGFHLKFQPKTLSSKFSSPKPDSTRLNLLKGSTPTWKKKWPNMQMKDIPDSGIDTSTTEPSANIDQNTPLLFSDTNSVGGSDSIALISEVNSLSSRNASPKSATSVSSIKRSSPRTPNGKCDSLSSSGSKNGSPSVPDVKSDSPRENAKKYFPLFNRTPPVSPGHLKMRQTKLTMSPLTPLNSVFSFKGSEAGSGKRSPRLTRLSKLKPETDGMEQYILDAGQKNIGAVQCPTCHMRYTQGEPTDEASHSKFHKRMLTVLKFNGWKKENVVAEFEDGSRIIVVLPTDTNCMKKVDSVKSVVDEDLAFTNAPSPACKSNMKTYMCIFNQRIIGVCIAEVITKGYRVIQDTQSQSSTQGLRAWYCSSQAESAKCGISRIWVDKGYRHQGIATRLLDAMRTNFMFSYHLSKKELAFSDPTNDGKMFAMKYTETPEFLVYKYNM
ncbi:unnamed protein product [Owenia fusiformis]|uniref:Uncharacterized protein n=1 Tax=Owenia fusiformis TaxID=6347 RepID=A0A8S4N2A8_OWEFU|nr:unnamed protein product [Owenia fusiformis]